MQSLDLHSVSPRLARTKYNNISILILTDDCRGIIILWTVDRSEYHITRANITENETIIWEKCSHVKTILLKGC